MSDSVTPWTVAHHAPLSMGFSRQEYWSGLSFPPPGDLPSPGVKPTSSVSPALAGGFFTTEPLSLGKDQFNTRVNALYRTQKGCEIVLSLSREEIGGGKREMCMKREEKRCRMQIRSCIEVESKEKKMVKCIP